MKDLFWEDTFAPTPEFLETYLTIAKEANNSFQEDNVYIAYLIWENVNLPMLLIH